MRRLVWVLLPAVLVAALVLGTRGDDGARTDAERVSDLNASFQCPTCSGQSVRDSGAGTAAAIRSEVSRRVADGQSDDEIRSYVVRQYGEEMLLNPPRDGVAALVWVLPVAAFVAALAGLALAFRRWRVVGDGGAEVSDEDRVLVERARWSR